MRRIAALLAFFVLLGCAAAQSAPGEKWVTSWAASVQGPYPVGNPSAQPDLSLVFPNPAQGARDQSFRLIVHPDIWGDQTRIRLSNALGKQSVTLDDVYAGLQLGGAEVVRGTNRPVTFGGKGSVTIAPGASALGSTSAAHGFAEQDQKRKQLNDFIRSSKVFDGVIDFDAVILDPATGQMKPEFVPESTTGGPGDKLHPNRVGYQVMGNSIDLNVVAGK